MTEVKYCPFCTKILKFNINNVGIDKKRETWCRKCGASWIPTCPDCKKPTWMSLSQEFKHPIKTNNCHLE